ncbi:hypothetical protein [Aeromonas hydrophila]|uniref:hypothetical protein n=1 Tax=Aeromonas hydrophila TaxID=644 RepID=UPI001FC86991|nr:hypothetical protein [Aeromonas hydrophila]GKR00173.1 hypothetical protein KAM461_44220 [Aeromonas hydrophila]
MKTIVIATVTTAALLTGCAGVPTDTASLRDSAAQPFRFVAEKLGGAQPITARQGDVTVKWRPDVQVVEAWRGEDSSRYTDVAFELRPLNKPGAKTAVERVALDDLHGQPKVVAALHLRTIGQHKVGGQECADNCVYLFPGLQYQLRVTMLRNGSPKISVPVGVVTVDDEGVTVRQQKSS